MSTAVIETSTNVTWKSVGVGTPLSPLCILSRGTWRYGKHDGPDSGSRQGLKGRGQPCWPRSNDNGGIHHFLEKVILSGRSGGANFRRNFRRRG